MIGFVGLNFDASPLGRFLIGLALAGTLISGMISTSLCSSITKGDIDKSARNKLRLFAFLPFITASVLCGLAMIEKLGMEAVYLMFGIPIILLCSHTLPLLIATIRSKSDTDIHKERMKITAYALIGNILIIGFSLMMADG